MPKPNEPQLIGNLKDHPDLVEKKQQLEEELERRHPGSVKILGDGTRMVGRYVGTDPDLDDGFAQLFQELARRSGKPRAPAVKVRKGDHVTVAGYRLQVGEVLDSGVAYLNLLDEQGHVRASCPADGERLEPDDPAQPPPPFKLLPSSARGVRMLIEALVDSLG
jgi:hypothetical protein